MIAIKEQFASLDAVQLNLGTGTGAMMNVVLALIMFGLALGIKPATFKGIFESPKTVLAGVAAQMVGLPLVTFVLALFLNRWITPMVALGMILVSSCPAGNISGVMSMLSKGNVGLSLSMTALSTLCAPLVMPFNFWAWGNLYLKCASLSDTMVIPQLEIPLGGILRSVFVILALPVLLGVLVTVFFPETAEKCRKAASVSMVVVLVVMLVVMLLPNWHLFTRYILFVFVIVLIHNAVALMTGYRTAHAFGLGRESCRSMSFVSGMPNSGLGLSLLLNPSIFDPAVWSNPATGIMYGGMLFVTAWWGIWHIVSGFAVSMAFSSRNGIVTCTLPG